MCLATLIWYTIYACCAVLAAKIFWQWSTKWNGSYICLTGRTAIVTGANRGLGYYTALDFAKRGARVILACRSKERAQEARRKIVEATANENVTCMLLDLASLQSVRDFAANFNRSEERLDILVNNAACSYINTDEEYTADGIHVLLHVNHIGPFLLTHLLIGKLRQSAPSRIINVSSIAAMLSSLSVDDLNNINVAPPTNIHKFVRDVRLYSLSKLCNILFTKELSRRLEGSAVTTNTLHPGIIYNAALLRGLNGFLFNALRIAGQFFLISVEEGAQTQIYLSVSKDTEGISGGLFTNCSRIHYKPARDPVLAVGLWERSEELAGLRGDEKLQRRVYY